jgi:hypothetical protein
LTPPPRPALPIGANSLGMGGGPSGSPPRARRSAPPPPRAAPRKPRKSPETGFGFGVFFRSGTAQKLAKTALSEEMKNARDRHIGAKSAREIAKSEAPEEHGYFQALPIGFSSSSFLRFRKRGKTAGKFPAGSDFTLPNRMDARSIHLEIVGAEGAR